MMRLLGGAGGRVGGAVLAALLQVLPLGRVAAVAPPPVLVAVAGVFRWLAAGAALLGAPQAVSGVSAVISSPLTAKGTNGVRFSYRITTTPYAATLYTVTPLPPRTALPSGLALQSASTGFITGTPREEGTWSLQISASDGGRPDRTTYATLVLTIVAGAGQPPAITLSPVDTVTTNGAPVLLSVVAARAAPQGYVWYHGDSPIAGASSSVLVFDPVTTNDAGPYHVVVTNSSGSATSAVANVTVLVPPAIRTGPQPAEVESGKDAGFTVTAQGTAPLHYTWLFGGAPIPAADSPSLPLPGVTPASEGDYSVVVSNAAGVVTSSPAHLTVKPATAPPVTLELLSAGADIVALQASVVPGSHVVVLVSQDLLQWTPILTSSVPDGAFVFQDRVASAPATRFYRASVTP